MGVICIRHLIHKALLRRVRRVSDARGIVRGSGVFAGPHGLPWKRRSERAIQFSIPSQAYLRGASELDRLLELRCENISPMFHAEYVGKKLIR